MKTRRCLSAAAVCLWLAWAAIPAYAEPVALDGFGPFAFRPGDVLRASFDLRWLAPPPPLDTYNVLIFMPGVSVIEPIGSYTGRLYDRGRLLGTYNGTGANAAQMGFGSWFTAPGTDYTRGNPTVVDFSTLQDGSFDGVVEFEIHDGLANIYRASDELDLDQALTPGIASGVGFAPRTFEILSPEPVPEPASLLLIGTGLAALAARRRGRAITAAR